MNMMGNFGGFLSSIICGHFVQRTGNWSLVFCVTAAMYVLEGSGWQWTRSPH